MSTKCGKYLPEARMHDVFENYVIPALSSLKKDVFLERQGKQYKLSFSPGKGYSNYYYIKERSTVPPFEGKSKVYYQVEVEVTSGDWSQKGGFGFDVIKF
jgi:hypothetical protein